MAKREQPDTAQRAPKLVDDSGMVEPTMAYEDFAAGRGTPAWPAAVAGGDRKTAAQWAVWFDALRQRSVVG